MTAARAILRLKEAEGLGALPILAAPVAVPLAQRAEIARACERVRSALLRVAGPARWNPAVPMPEGLGPLIDAESLDLPRLGVCRLDALCHADGTGLKFVEIQAGDPSGAAWTDAIADAFREVFPMQSYTPLIPLRRALLPAHVQRVAVVNEDHSFVRSDTDLMAKRLGLPARRIDPTRFAWDGARLTHEGVAYDAVVRDSHEELTLAPTQTAALQRALAAGLPRLNPFRDVWFDDKACFAMLWAARAALPADERAAVEAHVPETVLVEPGMRFDRAEWVLKPAVGYGGFGVVVGPAVDDAQWNAALAAPHRTVAQRVVAVPRQEVDRLEGGAVVKRRQHVTHSFWCHGGTFSGGFARAGQTPVVNVHQGGGIGPLIWVDG